jgi:hypothetical protein
LYRRAVRGVGPFGRCVRDARAGRRRRRRGRRARGLGGRLADPANDHDADAAGNDANAAAAATGAAAAASSTGPAASAASAASTGVLSAAARALSDTCSGDRRRSTRHRPWDSARELAANVADLVGRKG